MTQIPEVLRDGEHRCRVGNASFITLGARQDDEGALSSVFSVGALTSSSERFVMLKTWELIEIHAKVIEAVRPETIVQLGVFQGGSVALLNELAHPKKLVAAELEEEPVAALDAYIEQQDLSDTVSVHYGVDQADTATLNRLVDDAVGTQPLDLVVDDASHQLEPTRASFDALFPRLRPGGAYLIEDWGTGADKAANAAIETYLLGLGTPLANLVFELLLTCGSRPDVVESIEVAPEVVTITRGPARLDSGTFRLRDSFDQRWHTLLTGADHRSPA